MDFEAPLIRGRLIKRYKRFLAEIALDDGSVITVACPNTGSMLGLTAPGSVIWLSKSGNPARKYAHTWELIETDLGAGVRLVGINPNHPNRIVEGALAAGKIPELGGFSTCRREVKYGVSSRIDLLLDDPVKGRAYVEIKNVHLMRQGGLAEFPDSVTERGLKHLQELSRMVGEGHRAAMLYLIQRTDANRLSVARDIDPAYADMLQLAKAAGVETYAYRCHMTVDGIHLDQAVPIV